MKKEEMSMIKELLELTEKVMNQTKAHINVNVSNYGYLITVSVMENGFQIDKGYDGWFNIVSISNELTADMAAKEFERTKNYLEKLIHDAELKKTAA